VNIFPRTHDLIDRIIEDCAPRPRDNRQVEVTVTVDVDPVWHGHDLTTAEKRDIVCDAINARPGLEVIEAYTTTTSLGESRVQ
jgi:chorismate mutase